MDSSEVNIPNLSQNNAGDKSLSERLPQVEGLQCVICGQQYTLDEVTYVCPNCGQVGTLDVVLNTHYQSQRKRGPNVWAEDRFLPLASDMPTPEETVPLKVGSTPYYPPTKTKPFALIDDGRNPTGSFKDRASKMVTHHAITLGVPVVATASTGNAAAALAGMCAAAEDIQAVIFVPANAPQAKIAQLVIYGAHVVLIDGPYDAAFDLCWQACEEFGWYNRSTGINPFTSEGKKTIAWDIAFSGYDLPDVIFVSVGDGSIIGSIYKGFDDLQRLGWVERIPRIIGVQSQQSRALVDAWEQKLDPRDMTPQPAETIADSISAALPRDRAKALRAVRHSDGAFIAVRDDSILDAIPAMAQASGVFGEPAAAAAYAGWREALTSGLVSKDDHILILSTGSGLKDIQRAMQVAGDLKPTAPTMEAVKKAVAQFSR